jgi:hypothetical protein
MNIIGDLKCQYHHKKKVFSRYAADVNVTSAGGHHLAR